MATNLLQKNIALYFFIYELTTLLELLYTHLFNVVSFLFRKNLI